MSAASVTLRPAVRDDAARLAALHADRISEGFLPQLGPAFLTRLYRRIVVSPAGFATVASVDGRVVGFAAGATDLGAVYKSFVLRDGVMAGVGAAPQLLRSWRRVLETLRYPDSTGDLPEAEILAVAVDAGLSGRGVGRELVAACQAELDVWWRRGGQGGRGCGQRAGARAVRTLRVPAANAASRSMPAPSRRCWCGRRRRDLGPEICGREREVSESLWPGLRRGPRRECLAAQHREHRDRRGEHGGPGRKRLKPGDAPEVEREDDLHADEHGG